MASHMALKRCCCVLQAEKSSFLIPFRHWLIGLFSSIHLHLACALASGSLARDFVQGTPNFYALTAHWLERTGGTNQWLDLHLLKA